MATEAKGQRVNINGKITDVLFKDATAREQLANIGKTVYPVGSIYISVTDTSPASLFGGTWEQLKDKFLLAAGDTYTAGSTGGEAVHTLTANEMPVHSHGLNNHTHGIPSLSGSTNSAGVHNHGVPFAWADISPQGGGSDKRMSCVGNWWSGTNDNGAHSHSVTTNSSTTGGNSGNTTNTGSGAAHNNMPPYLAVYAWKRVA